jgi:hypothetical protein
MKSSFVVGKQPKINFCTVCLARENYVTREQLAIFGTKMGKTAIF